MRSSLLLTMKHFLALALTLAAVGCGDNISPPNIPPEATTDLSLTVAEDGTIQVEVDASDPEGARLAYTATTPLHGMLSGAGPAYTYTPYLNYVGTDTLEIEVSDGYTTTTVSVTITITPVNDAPIAEDLRVDTQEDAAIGVTLLASDVDDTSLTYNLIAQPAHGTLTGTPPAVTYTPDLHYYGEDTFTFQVTDSALDSNLATVTIAVANVIFCGDGVTEGDEGCDDGNFDNNDACLNTCASATCGDGVVQATVEQCDDGNTVDGDGCESTCILTAPPVCGDGILNAGEECDDGNTADDDGCGHSCLIERCGDGLIQLGAGESCDDGNNVDGDGCDAMCHVEAFNTTAPVKISGALTCTTAVANAARKIAVDGSGTIYAVMNCEGVANVAVSADRGISFSAPADLSTSVGLTDLLSQVAVATGPSGVAYVAMMFASGQVYLRTTEDAGATWGAAALIGQATSTATGLSLESFNDNVFIGFSGSGGVTVARNGTRGAGAFEETLVTMSIAYFDLLYDAGLGTLAVCADTPGFHIRASTDGGVSFAAEVNPPGQQYYSDWAIGNGQVFSVGTNLGSSGDATSLYVIPTSDLGTSSSVTGLPSVTAAQTRSLAADHGGNAYVASQLDAGGVQLDRLGFGASTFDMPRSLSATGGSPVVAALPGNQGAAVVFTVGTEVWATIQAY
ncbi:MAG: Ig-like domain-containing protein [Kofleriaceae bacterium]